MRLVFDFPYSPAPWLLTLGWKAFCEIGIADPSALESLGSGLLAPPSIYSVTHCDHDSPLRTPRYRGGGLPKQAYGGPTAPHRMTRAYPHDVPAPYTSIPYGASSTTSLPAVAPPSPWPRPGFCGQPAAIGSLQFLIAAHRRLPRFHQQEAHKTRSLFADMSQLLLAAELYSRGVSPDSWPPAYCWRRDSPGPRSAHAQRRLQLHFGMRHQPPGPVAPLGFPPHHYVQSQNLPVQLS